jgi:hypothetical protein
MHIGLMYNTNTAFKNCFDDANVIVNSPSLLLETMDADESASRLKRTYAFDEVLNCDKWQEGTGNQFMNIHKHLVVM